MQEQILKTHHLNLNIKSKASETKEVEPTYSAVTGVTGLSELMCGRQRIPGKQRQVGPCRAILRDREETQS